MKMKGSELRKASISRNYIYNLIYQLVIIIIPIILIPYLTRTFSVETIGIYEYSLNVVSYFVYFAVFSVAIYGNRKIAEYSDNKNEMSVNFWSIILIKVVTCITAIVFYSIYIVIFEIDNWLIFALQAILILSAGIDVSWFFVGLENFKAILFRNLIVRIISLVLILLFVRSNDQIYLFILIITGSEFLGQFLMWISLIKNQMVRRFTLNKQVFLTNTIGLVRSFLPQIIVFTYSLSSLFILGNISNNTQVAYLAYSKKMTMIIITIVTSLGAVLVPKVSKLYFEKNDREANNLLSKSVDIMLYLSLPLLTGLIVVSSDLIVLVLGQPYVDMVPIFIILSLRIFPQVLINFIIGQYMIPKYQNRKLVLPHLLAIIVFISLVTFWGNRYEAYGVSVSIFLSDLILLGLLILEIRKEVNILKWTIANWKIFLASSIMFVIMFLYQVYLKEYAFTLLFSNFDNGFIINSVRLLSDIIIGMLIFLISILILNPIQNELILTYLKRSLVHKND